MTTPEAGSYAMVPLDEAAAEVLEGAGTTVAVQQDEDNGDETQEEKATRFEHMHELRTEVGRLTDLANQAQRNIDNLRGFWGGKETDMKHTIEDLARQIQTTSEQLRALEIVGTADDCAPPPGPKSLYWVKGGKFTSVCSLVVIMNLGTMFYEMVHPQYKAKFFILDQVVLVFYITEIVLKCLLFRQELLLGPISIVWWNWLDVLIVFAGVLDQWVQPLLPKSKDAAANDKLVQVIKMLRVARLARILKTVRVFLQSDLSWAEGKRFQLFIMGTIAANSLIMSFESDYPDFAGWFYVEQVLLIIFSFELLVRLRRWGCRFFIHESDFMWNNLDFIIVFGGIVDQWLMPFIGMVQQLLGMPPQDGGGQMGQIMTMLRMARLLRILRLVRLVKNIPPLFTLIVGILQAMQGMAWVLVLTAVFLYAFALLSVRLVGHGLLFGGQAPPDVANIFPTVPQSMFVLFKVMNGDTELVEPLFQALPISKLGFVLYMVVSSWAILSILTAVVSENMIQATEHHRNELEEEQAFTKEREVREYLGKLFADIDKDGSNELGEAEFEQMIQDKSICADLTEKTGLQERDLEQIFKFLMTGDKVSREVFIDALQSESHPVTERTIFRLEKRLIDFQVSFEKHVKCLAEKESQMLRTEEAESKQVGENHMMLESLLHQQGTQQPISNNILQPCTSPMASPISPIASMKESIPPIASKKEKSISTRKGLEDQLLPFQMALQIIEHRLDYIAFESNSQPCDRYELSNIAQREASCDAVLGKLEENLGMSKHNVRVSLQSILGKMELHCKNVQQIGLVEPLMKQLETFHSSVESKLATHHSSVAEQLMANVQQKLDLSHTWLMDKYEMRLESEKNKGVFLEPSARSLSFVAPQESPAGTNSPTPDRSVIVSPTKTERVWVPSSPQLRAFPSLNQMSAGATPLLAAASSIQLDVRTEGSGRTKIS